MIIVNQEKESIYNFENVKSIDVIKKEIFITDDILADTGIFLGKYKTEERAKEVLQEIVTAYNNFEYLKIMTDEQKNNYCNILQAEYKRFDTYEMPEE